MTRIKCIGELIYGGEFKVAESGTVKIAQGGAVTYLVTGRAAPRRKSGCVAPEIAFFINTGKQHPLTNNISSKHCNRPRARLPFARRLLSSAPKSADGDDLNLIRAAFCLPLVHF